MFWHSVQSVCKRNKHRHVLAFEQQNLRRLLAFARVQQRLEIENDGVRKGFLFLLRIQWSFFEIMLPTLVQFETLVDNRLPSFQGPCKLRLSCQTSSALLCFLSKASTSFSRPERYSGQPCKWQPWN